MFVFVKVRWKGLYHDGKSQNIFKTLELFRISPSREPDILGLVKFEIKFRIVC